MPAEIITKQEVEFTKRMAQRSLQRCVDIYLAYLDKHPVEEGTDMQFVFNVVWGGNYRAVRGEIGIPTIVFLEVQFDLCWQMFHWQMKEIARKEAWKDLPRVFGATSRTLTKLAKLAVRHYLPITRPRVTLDDFVAITDFTAQE